MNLRVGSSVAIAFMLLSTFAGCGRGITPPSTVPVHGTVMLNGKPAPGIVVKFHPQFDIGSVKFIPYGETGKDGTFLLNTGAAGNGAPPGDYVVTFEKPKIESDRQNSGIEIDVDEFKGRYSDPAQSSAKVTIKRGDNTLDAFQLD